MRVERRLLSGRHRGDGRSWNRLSPDQRAARDEYLREFSEEDVWERESCPACGSDESYLVGEKDVFGLPTKNHLCRSCGLIFRSPLLTSQATSRYYERISWRLRGKSNAPAARKKVFDARVARFAPPRFEFVRRAYPELKEGALVVELGAYDGANLMPFKDAGFRTIGFDIDDGAFGPGREAGLDLRKGVPGAIALDEKPSLIVLSHFVEHLVRPEQELKAIADLLPAEARLFIEVPGVRDVGARDLLGYFMAEHNFSFDLASLTTLLGTAELALVEGDEVVRGLFKKGAPIEQKRDPEALLRELAAAEARLGGWGLRAWYHRVRVFAVNEILYRIS